MQLSLEDELSELLALDGLQFPVALFNGPICTTAGLYRVSELSVEAARELIAKHGFESAVGHRASAEVLSSILQIEVPMNRVEYRQEVGQLAIALKMKVRPPEGQILTTEEMLKIGFGLQLLQRLE